MDPNANVLERIRLLKTTETSPETVDRYRKLCDAYSQWRARGGFPAERSLLDALAAAEAAARAREPGVLDGPATAVAVVSVWSNYGHQFVQLDGYESCMVCGALYELVADPANPSAGTYQARNGQEPQRCSRDTSMVHGLEDASDPYCNCVACTP